MFWHLVDILFYKMWVILIVNTNYIKAFKYKAFFVFGGNMQDSTKLHKFNIICHKNYCIYNKYDIILLYDRSENMRNLEMPRHGWEGISNGGEIYGNNNNSSDSDILLDEVYKEWLKFGGL